VPSEDGLSPSRKLAIHIRSKGSVLHAENTNSESLHKNSDVNVKNSKTNSGGAHIEGLSIQITFSPF